MPDGKVDDRESNVDPFDSSCCCKGAGLLPYTGNSRQNGAVNHWAMDELPTNDEWQLAKHYGGLRENQMAAVKQRTY
jgi:hypothetical protein